MYTLLLPLIIHLYVLANSVIAKNAPFNITCESTSKCGNVVVENEDTYNCLTEIAEEFKKKNITEYTVRFYVEKKSIDIEGMGLEYACQVVLYNGCQQENKSCNCSGNYNIDWNFTASYDKHNNNQIQARLFKSSSSTLFSNILPGPRIIKDPRTGPFQLLVNNNEVQDNSRINITKDDDALLFKILPQESAEVLSLHYAVNDQIFRSDMKTHLKPQNIIIKIKLCDKELRSYNLSLHYDDPKKTVSKIPESSTNTTSKVENESEDTCLETVIIFVVISAVLFIILITFCVLWKFFHRFKYISSQNNYPEITTTGQQLFDIDRDSRLQQLEVNHLKLTEEYRMLSEEKLVLTMRNKKLEEKIQELENEIKDLTNTNQKKGNEDFGVRRPLLYQNV